MVVKLFCIFKKLAIIIIMIRASQVVQWWKICLPIQETQEMWVWSLGQKDPLEKEVATHSSITAWKIPRTEEPGGLYGVPKSQTQLSTHTHTHTHTHTGHLTKKNIWKSRILWPQWLSKVILRLVLGSEMLWIHVVLTLLLQFCRFDFLLSVYCFFLDKENLSLRTLRNGLLSRSETFCKKWKRS